MFDNLKKKIGGWFKRKDAEEVAEPEKKDSKKFAKEAEKRIKKAREEIEELKKDEKKKEKDKRIEELKEEIEKGKKEIGEEKKEKKVGKKKAKEKKEEEKKSEEKKEEKVEEEVKEEEQEKVEKVIEEEVKETPKEELREELKDEDKGFFFNLKKKLTSSVLKQKEFDDIFEELEMVLLENNVALEVVDAIKKRLSEDLVNLEIKRSEIEKTIFESLKGAIEEVLIEKKGLIDEIKNSLDMPYVILFFGINGSGKTTSVAKMAHRLKEAGVSVVLGAADTFRAASIEQLETHAKKVGVPIIKGEYGSDPASVGFEAVKYAKSHKIKVVLIDTAGRMYTKQNLMKEMEKIVRVCKPNLKVFVGESITGNDATEQAKMFSETAGIDGIILTKADVDEKAGAILSVGYVTGKPILFLGTGQDYKDFEEFKKESVLKGLGLVE